MADSKFRGAILQQMRASPLAEHALPLADLVAGSNGAWFVAGLVHATGMTEGDVRDLITSLPPLDFYVPARDDRLTWTGGPSLLVAAMPTSAMPTTAYGPDGAPISLDLAHARPAAPLFYLQFAEHKAERLEPQPAVTGSRIEDAGDGEFAAAFIRKGSDGKEIIYQLRDLVGGPRRAQYCPPDIPGCPPEGSGGGSGGDETPPPPTGTGTTYLTALVTHGVCDNGDCSQGNEFEFRARTDYGQSSTLRIEGVGSSVSLLNLHSEIAPWIPSTMATIDVGVWETDGLSSDDHFEYVHAPGYVTDPVLQVTPTNNNGAGWLLREYPHLDPYNDPVKVEAAFGWTGSR